MVGELRVSPISPSDGSSSRCRPLLGWVPWDGSPASSLQRRHSDSSRPGVALLLAPLRRSGRPEATRSPRFLSNPCARAPVSDPGGGSSPGPRADRPARWRAPFAFCVVHRIGLHNFAAFGAPCRRPCTRCLRFAAALADGPRKTRFRPVVPALTGWDLHPRVALKGFSRYIASPFPRLSWRKNETAPR